MDVRKLKHTVWPFQITLKTRESSPEDVIDIESWCNDRLGRRFDAWYGYNVEKDKRIYAFRDEATMLVFKITWGHKKWV